MEWNKYRMSTTMCEEKREKNESCWTRTNDSLIKSEVLYRLS